MRTIDELDRLHAVALPGEWVHDERDMWGCVQALASASGILLTVSRAAGGDADQKATAAYIAAAKNAWPEVSARLRAAEAECERLRAQNAEQHTLLRWFLDGDDHTHVDDCPARGQHDCDVCRNRPCAHDCDWPHCTCDATEMRDRARAALGEM